MLETQALDSTKFFSVRKKWKSGCRYFVDGIIAQVETPTDDTAVAVLVAVVAVPSYR
jgi:hypothetical protein